MTQQREIAVCGCGPAGLAAALLLHRAGHRVTLIERFIEPQPLGSGLLLQPTGLAVLDAFALTTALDRHTNLSAALRDYALLRRWHVRLFQLASRIFTPFYQSDSRALAFVRDWITAPLSRMPIGDQIVARLVSGMTTSPLAGQMFKPFRWE